MTDAELRESIHELRAAMFVVRALIRFLPAEVRAETLACIERVSIRPDVADVDLEWREGVRRTAAGLLA